MKKRIKNFENKILDPKSNTHNLDTIQLLCLGMYQNLSNSILTEKFEIKKLPSKFLKHCIIDAREEDKLIKTIPTFNHINNQVSLKFDNNMKFSLPSMALYKYLFAKNKYKRLPENT